LERWAGALFLVAAGAHGFLTPAHFEEWWGYGLFFLFASALQAVWGLALLTHAINPKDAGPHWRRMTTGVYGLGILGSVVAITVYVVTRTVGIPGLGPEGITREPEVGIIDVVTKAAEAVTVVLLAVLLRRHLARPADATGQAG